MTNVGTLHRSWMKSLEYTAEYDALGEEFQLATMLIAARTRAGLSQPQLAKRLKTSQSYIARLESGGVTPSTRALERFAAATGSRLRIAFEPLETQA